MQVGAANLVNPYASKEIVEALPGEMERLERIIRPDAVISDFREILDLLPALN